MKRSLTLTREPIDIRSLDQQAMITDEIGAAVRFLGFVRGSEGGVPIRALEYEAFARMVEHQFGLLFDELEKRWPVDSVRLVHRVGTVGVGEAAVWVEVTTPHRAEAFQACQWLIDEMKRVVPIWKRAVGQGTGDASGELKT